MALESLSQTLEGAASAPPGRSASSEQHQASIVERAAQSERELRSATCCSVSPLGPRARLPGALLGAIGSACCWPACSGGAQCTRKAVLPLFCWRLSCCFLCPPGLAGSLAADANELLTSQQPPARRRFLANKPANENKQRRQGTRHCKSSTALVNQQHCVMLSHPTK